MSPPIRKPRKIVSDTIDQTKPPAIIVAKFGGLSEFSRKTGFSTGTVYGWMKRGTIPTRTMDSGATYQAHIMDVATDHKIKIKPTDFLTLDMPQVA